MFSIILMFCLFSTPNNLETDTCNYSTSKVRLLVDSNWRAIQQKARFTVSDAKNFEINDYRQDGDDLEVSVLSKGFIYDISFTVSFDDYFTDNCDLKGKVLDVYNYKKL